MTMTELNLDSMQGNIAINIVSQATGQYCCELASTLMDSPIVPQPSHGQSADHAIAIALERLAQSYRERAEEQQNLAPLAVERSPSGEVIEKRYHVVVHFEDVLMEESKFEASHSTMLGNTIIENATINIYEISPDLPEDQLVCFRH